jgi:hypothetical protein
MIDFDKLPEFEGFTVYDKDTGDPIYPDEKVNGTETIMHVLAEDGTLYIANCAYGGLQKGKYIIQINGEYYKW